ncbi:MAG: DNA translocase FtsK 4TM domain-containing protein, partial [Patescibacteria group bacterium]
MVKRNPRANRGQRKKDHGPPIVRSETLHSILGVLAAIAAAFFVLASFRVGGPVGDFIYSTLTDLFGIGYFLIPLSLGFLAVGLFRDRGPGGLGKARMAGALILFLAGTALLSLMNDEYGGFAGRLIARPFVGLFDTTVATILLSGIAVVAALLALDTPLRFPRLAGLPFFGKKEKADELSVTGYSDTETEEEEASDEEEHDGEAPPVKTKPKEKKPQPPIGDDEVPGGMGFALK